MILKSGAVSDQSIDKLLDTINAGTAAMRDGDKRARYEVLSSCYKLAQELEEPGEFLERAVWGNVSQLAALRTALDLDLFRHINAQGPAKSTAQLAEAVNADPALMARILRVLASANIVRESTADRFTSSTMSMALVDPDYALAIKYTFDFHIPVNLGTPQYLRENKYQDPSDFRNAPIHFTQGGKGEMGVFQILNQKGRTQGFQALMKEWCKHHPYWTDEDTGYYPFRERLIQGAKKGSDEVFMVDVGGGSGIDFTKILAHHPKEILPGSLILQDLPLQIDSIPAGFLPSTVQTMGHDFFTPQPIKGKTRSQHTTTVMAVC